MKRPMIVRPDEKYREWQRVIDLWHGHENSVLLAHAACGAGLPYATFANRLRQAKAAGIKPSVAFGCHVRPDYLQQEPQQAPMRLTPSPTMSVAVHLNKQGNAESSAPSPASGSSKPVTAAMQMQDEIRVCAVGDLHDTPGLDKRRFQWIGRHLKETRPHKLQLIGDAGTLDSCNTHVANETYNGRSKPTFLADMASLNEAFDALNIEVPSDLDLERHITLGNHERRLYVFQDNAPETWGMMQNEFETILKNHGYGWTPYGQFRFIGQVGYVHVPLNRLGKGYGGKNAEIQVANDAVFDVVFGHSHTKREHTAAKIGPSQKVTVVNLGSALPQEHVEHYAEHNTTGWTWGIFDQIIRNGRLETSRFISMRELEERYG